MQIEDKTIYFASQDLEIRKILTAEEMISRRYRLQESTEGLCERCVLQSLAFVAPQEEIQPLLEGDGGAPAPSTTPTIDTQHQGARINDLDAPAITLLQDPKRDWNPPVAKHLHAFMSARFMTSRLVFAIDASRIAQGDSSISSIGDKTSPACTLPLPDSRARPVPRPHPS